MLLNMPKSYILVSSNSQPLTKEEELWREKQPLRPLSLLNSRILVEVSHRFLTRVKEHWRKAVFQKQVADCYTVGP